MEVGPLVEPFLVEEVGRTLTGKPFLQMMEDHQAGVQEASPQVGPK